MEPKKVAKKEERAHEGKPYWRIQFEGSPWASCWSKTIADKCVVGTTLLVELEENDKGFWNLTKAEPYAGTMPEPPPTQAQGGQSAPTSPDTMSKGDWANKDAMEHRRAIVNTLIMAGRQPLIEGKDNLLFWREARMLWEWVQHGPPAEEEDLFPLPFPAKTAPQQGQKAGGGSPQGEATAGQRSFIGQLVKDAKWTNTDLADHIAKTYPSAIREGKGSTQALTQAQASELIESFQKGAATDDKS